MFMAMNTGSNPTGFERWQLDKKVKVRHFAMSNSMNSYICAESFLLSIKNFLVVQGALYGHKAKHTPPPLPLPPLPHDFCPEDLPPRCMLYLPIDPI